MPEKLRAFIDAQVCPWCGKGAFRQLGVHTVQKHGISAFEVKNMAGLKTEDPICSKESSEAMSLRPQNNNESFRKSKKHTGVPHTRFTKAGMASQKAQAQRLAEDLARAAFRHDPVMHEEWRLKIKLSHSGNRVFCCLVCDAQFCVINLHKDKGRHKTCSDQCLREFRRAKAIKAARDELRGYFC